MATQNVEELERQFNSAMEEADKGSTLEAVQRVYDELGGDDPDVVTDLLHPKVEVTVDTRFMSGKTYKGPRGFLNWRREMGELFEEERFAPVGVRSAGQSRWVVLGRMRTKEADGGAEQDVPLAHIFEQRDGKVARIAVYSEIAEALDSVGLYT